MSLQKMLPRLPGSRFPRALFQEQPKSLSSTAWIDGVRGLAALIVTVTHLFFGEIAGEGFFLGYGSGGPLEEQKYTSLLQLPPVSIIFAARAMVPLFFVVSGFCISLSPMLARDGRHSQDMLHTALSNAVFRRGLRLFLPVLAMALASQLLYAAGAYSASHSDAAALPPVGSISIRAHAGYLLSYAGNMADQVLNGSPGPTVAGTEYFPVGLSPQLWTIPLELRGSLVVYLCMLGLARLRHAPRAGVLAGLAVTLLLRGWWETATFVTGLLIAEAQGSGSEQRHEQLEDNEECALDRHWRRRCPSPSGAALKRMQNVGVGVLFLVGIYLLCVPSFADQFYSHGPYYDFLFTRLSPLCWLVYGLDRTQACWRALGGMAFVAALACQGSSAAQMLRRPFVSAAAQYFGRISFMMYVVHEMVFQTLKPRLQAGLASIVGGDWPRLALYGARIPLLVCVFWIAEVLVEVLDKRSVGLAKRLLEKWTVAH